MADGETACGLDHAAVSSDFHFLAQFARVLRRDLDAVAHAITSRWSNGPVEGHINRLKMIKRQMYGRAGFELLRARVLPWESADPTAAPRVREIRFTCRSTGPIPLDSCYPTPTQSHAPVVDRQGRHEGQSAYPEAAHRSWSEEFDHFLDGFSNVPRYELETVSAQEVLAKDHDAPAHRIVVAGGVTQGIANQGEIVPQFRDRSRVRPRAECAPRDAR